MNMKKTMMYLPEELHGYLAREAGVRRVSMAHIAREAIAEYRAKRTAEHPPQVSALFGVLDDTDDRRDLALSVDETLHAHFAEAGEWERENGLADDAD